MSSGTQGHSGYRQAPPAVLAQRRALADKVSVEITLAGLPCQLLGPIGSNGSNAQGVVIEIDAGDDAGGGVFVHWNVSNALADETGGALLTEQFEHPSLAHAYRISEHMRVAVTGILTDAGFPVIEPDGDIRVSTLQVVSARPG